MIQNSLSNSNFEVYKQYSSIWKAGIAGKELEKENSKILNNLCIIVNSIIHYLILSGNNDLKSFKLSQSVFDILEPNIDQKWINELEEKYLKVENVDLALYKYVEANSFELIDKGYSKPDNYVYACEKLEFLIDCLFQFLDPSYLDSWDIPFDRNNYLNYFHDILNNDTNVRKSLIKQVFENNIFKTSYETLLETFS